MDAGSTFSFNLATSDIHKAINVSITFCLKIIGDSNGILDLAATNIHDASNGFTIHGLQSLKSSLQKLEKEYKENREQ